MEQAPQKPSKPSRGSGAKLTEAMPARMPALAISVISWGRTVPRGLASRSYQPQPGRSPKSLAKPATLVDSARSAEQAMMSGRP